MLDKEQEKIIKKELNKYMNNIKIPENLEEIIMEDMNKIKDEEISENNKGKKSNAKKIIGIAASLVVVAGVAGFAGYKAGWINKENNNVISASQSETGSKTPLASNDKLKSLYDIEEYTDNLTDAANGKLAFLKLLENNELQTEEHEDYYTYIDFFDNKYNIKEITNVTSKEGMMGNDDSAALFKVTVTYVDNNNKTKTMDLAIILQPNHDAQNRGTYDSYTGSTSFVKNFTNLYDDNEESSDKLKSLYDIEEYTDNLTDAANGKLACLKLLENNELQTEEHEDYYTYIDFFDNKYNIKEITNVTSKEGMMGNDDSAALFKVTVTYVDNNNKTKTMDLAIILQPNHDAQNRGTYDSYTGSTSFVKNFTNLYDDNEESSDKLKSLYDIEEYTDNLTDAANGKLACLKLLENNELQTEEHEDYYTYIDFFDNKYNIKEITNVTSKEGMMGNDDSAALFKVTVTYVDNNNKTKTMDLAIILQPNHDAQNRGTYDSYTGSTSFVKNFTNLYDYDND